MYVLGVKSQILDPQNHTLHSLTDN